MADLKEIPTPKFRFPGHQTLVFRHGWIGKGVCTALLLLAGEVGG